MSRRNSSVGSSDRAGAVAEARSGAPGRVRLGRPSSGVRREEAVLAISAELRRHRGFPRGAIREPAGQLFLLPQARGVEEHAAAQRYTLNWRKYVRMARMRTRCSDIGMRRAAAMASLAWSRLYGLTTSASVSSRAAPVNSLSTSTPASSSRAATNSFATRFMPSCRLLT